jgi:hypothetical protein
MRAKKCPVLNPQDCRTQLSALHAVSGRAMEGCKIPEEEVPAVYLHGY